ncbi:MAG: hypothetical protein BECKG1743D_GA0114223_112712 [Candidatus Kentron sp. G]|nr:MAG: hypothetical protein BECKG1743D_GA0114223_112712 [Candidatus Kentron sp. G]
MKFGSEKAELMEVNEHFERLSLTYPYLGGVQDDFCIQLYYLAISCFSRTLFMQLFP